MNADTASSPPTLANKEAWVTLTLLTSIGLVNYFDRFILAMLVEPIRTEMGLTDGQFGVLTGTAFALIYALAALPIAHLADRRGARPILAMSLALWSVMTMACGAAQNFVHLFVGRFGVGAGEAGSVPASHALISSVFPPERRGLALSIFTAGSSAGILVAFAAGGFLDASVGWRGTFLIAGAVAFPLKVGPV